MNENTSAISLAQVKKGRVLLPHFVLIYGVDGVGKTTFAAEAPNPVFIGTEMGFGQLDVARFPTPKNFQEVLATIQLLLNEKHDYKTLVIDSLDWLEPLVFAHVCAKHGWKSIEDPGYGKGYVEANNAWLELIGLLKKLRVKMNVILIAHAAIRTFTDPEQNAAYDRYQLKLAGQGAKTDASALWREAVDNVLFANFEVSTTQAKGERKAKAFGDGSRIIYTERRPAFDAKNRFSLPFELPLSWEEYAKACAAACPNESDEITQLAGALKGHETEALAWLRNKGWLNPDGKLSDLEPKHRRRILNNPDGFIEVITTKEEN
jgi:hypothetical protein